MDLSGRSLGSLQGRVRLGGGEIGSTEFDPAHPASREIASAAGRFRIGLILKLLGQRSPFRLKSQALFLFSRRKFSRPDHIALRLSQCQGVLSVRCRHAARIADHAGSSDHGQDSQREV